MTDAPFPTVTDFATEQPELAGLGWQEYPRLSAFKGALDDLATDIVRHHITEGERVDDAVVQYTGFLFREVDRSFGDVTQAAGAVNPKNPCGQADFQALERDCTQRIGALAVECRRNWSKTGLGAATVKEALELYRDDLLVTVRRAFEAQIIAAIWNTPTDGDS